MPPTYNKYVAWGFADHSLRIGNYDNDKAVFVCEAVAQACGEIVACVCLSDKTIVTAGTSTVSRRSQRIVDIIPKAQFTPRGNGMEASISTHRHKTFICSYLFYLVHKVNSLLNLCRVNWPYFFWDLFYDKTCHLANKFLSLRTWIFFTNMMNLIFYKNVPYICTNFHSIINWIRLNWISIFILDFVRNLPENTHHNFKNNHRHNPSDGCI